MIEENERKFEEFERARTDYKTVLELAQSQVERDALSKIKEDLDLREFDSLWSIAGIMQLYLRTVSDFNASMKNSVYDAVKTFGDNGGIVRPTNNTVQDISPANYFFIAAAMLLLGSLTFVAGVVLSSASPVWLTGLTSASDPGLEQLAYLVLSAPAGWILCLILSVPAFFYIKTYYALFKLARQKKEKVLNLTILTILVCLVCIALVVFIKIMF